MTVTKWFDSEHLLIIMRTTLWHANVGPSNNSSNGSTPTYCHARMYAFGLYPSASAFSSDIISTAEAPNICQ